MPIEYLFFYMYKIIFQYTNDERFYQVGSIYKSSNNEIEDVMIVPTDGFFSKICFETDDLNEAERVIAHLNSSVLNSKKTNHIDLNTIQICEV